MAFKAYENDGGLMVEGNYEVICLKAEETLTKNGNPVIAFDFQVRSDVEQRYQRKHIFKNFYMDSQTGEWPMEKIGKMANALGIEKDVELELSDLVGRCCILHMKPFEGQDGVKRDAIFYAKRTEAGEAIQTIPGQQQDESGFTPVQNEELPF